MSSDLFSLSGKVAAISGCTRGIGRDMAIALAEAGAGMWQRSPGTHTRDNVLILRLTRCLFITTKHARSQCIQRNCCLGSSMPYRPVGCQ